MPMVLLIGNYSPDRQQSMQRFGTMMLEGLREAGVPAELIRAEPVFGQLFAAGSFIAKWLGYVDKFLVFPFRLRRKLRGVPSLVHICDHSNAMYARKIRGLPVVVTCHDLLAVRAARGEVTGCPASPTGKLLQRWIVSGLARARVIACDSDATLEDVRKLVPRKNDAPKLEKITLGLSHPYRKLPLIDARKRLAELSPLEPDTPFVLHVGSNLGYKNREGLLRIFARAHAKWSGRLVCVGEPLSPSLRTLAQQLGIADRVTELPGVSNELLEVLYNCAVALVFPSTHEGFGWPIAEAQACGCPVLCANRAPMNEVAGPAGLTHDVNDEAGFAADLLRLTDPAERERWSTKSLENAQRFSTAPIISEYCAVYRSLASV